jgi:hypothetical protein
MELILFTFNQRGQNESWDNLARDQVGRLPCTINIHRTTHLEHLNVHGDDLSNPYIYWSIGPWHLLDL